MSTRIMLVVLTAITVCAVSPARADKSGDDSGEAKRHFVDGTKYYQLGDFNKAIEEYKAGFQIKPDPVFLYNIAQAYRLENDFQHALFFYKMYLNSLPNASNRAEVEERIRKLDQQVSEQHAIATSPPNTTVPPDDASRRGKRPPEPTVEHVEQAPPIAATEAPPHSSETATSSSTTLTATATPSAERSERTPIYKKWWLWTIVGVVVVGAAVGAGVGIAASSGGAPSSQLGTVRF